MNCQYQKDQLHWQLGVVLNNAQFERFGSNRALQIPGYGEFLGLKTSVSWKPKALATMPSYSAKERRDSWLPTRNSGDDSHSRSGIKGVQAAH